MANTIDLMGVLNSITQDKTLAKAEQIEITLFDGAKRKIPAELLNYVKGMTESQILEFLTQAQAENSTITDNYVFLCLDSLKQQYEAGHIYYYDKNSKALTDITPATGGGGDSSSVKISATAPVAEIAANTEFSIPYSWSSKNVGYGLVYCLVDGTIHTRTRMQPGSGSWTLTNGLSRGSHTLSMYVTDSAGVSSTHWTAVVTVGSLAIESTFNETTTYQYGKTISIPYIYYTNDSDYTHNLIITVDDESTETTAGTQGAQLTYGLSGLTAGEHTVKLQIKATKDDSEKVSNILTFHILVAQSGVLYATVYGSDTINVKEREQVTLSVRVTMIGQTTFTATLDAYQYVEGAENDGWVTDPTVYASSATWHDGINSFIITNLNSVGSYKFVPRVTKGSITPEKDPVFYVNVSQADTLHLDSVVDESLLLHLSAKGKSNTADDKTYWLDTSKEEILKINPNANVADRNVVDVKLNNFNYSSNGWLADSNGQTRLLINGGAYAEIDIAPFLNEIDKGLTFDIEFATEDILDSSARVVSCFDGTRGFWIDTENATLSNNNSKLEKEVVATTVTNPNIILRYENATNSDGAYIYYLRDQDGNYVYEDTEQTIHTETLDAETTYTVNGEAVVITNTHKQTPVYMTYVQYTSSGPFQTNFPSNEKTRITFVIQRGEQLADGSSDFGDYQLACMCIYVNGVLTSIERITDYNDLIGVQFENGGQKIMLGCDNELNHTGKAEIYNIRLYNRALSMEEILTNYISDIEDPIEQDDMIRRNALAGTTSTDLPVMEFYFNEDDWSNLSKENKMFGRVTFTNFNGTTENFDTRCRCAWQGTSTLAYAVKNYKINLYSTLKNKNGKLKGDKKYKFDLGNGVQEYTFTLKADFMDSAMMRNTGTGNFVSDLGTELNPAQEYIPACRSAIYGFPILLYLTTIPGADPEGDLVPTSEKPGTRKLLGVYNLNLDKNCTDSLSLYTKSDIRSEISQDLVNDFDATYPNWDCMSFEGAANSDTTAGAFASIEDTSIYSDFEMRFEDPEDILDEGKKTTSSTSAGSSAKVTISNNIVTIAGINSDINGSYTPEAPNKLIGSKHTIYKDTEDLFITSGSSTTLNLAGSYTMDYGFEYDAKVQSVYLTMTATSSDDTFNIMSVESAESRIARRYSHLKKFIRWVKESDTDTFKANFQKHANLSSTIDYFLTVFVMLMADNLGKNCMWNTWGPVSTKTKSANPSLYTYEKDELYNYDDYIWYPQFYDMDTCLGLDNSGNMRFDVSEEIEPGVFNTSSSVFWTKFREAFADEILARYKELRGEPVEGSTRKAAYTTDSFLKYFYTNQVAKISETNYNNNIKQKYLAHPDYLFMMHGRQYEFFRRWIDQRLYFIDSLYEYGEDWGKESTVRVEYAKFAEKPVTFSISTYKPSYVAVKFSATAGNTKKLKVPRGATVDFSGWVSTGTDQEVILFMSPNIKTIGDISPYTPKVVEISRMTKLTSLCVGSEENPNPNLSSISLGSNTYLTDLRAEYCTAMSGNLNVSNCTNLKYISTIGSTIPYVQFNANGGALTEAHFSYATTSVVLKNYQLLSKITFEGLDKLTTLTIENCPLLLGSMDENGKVTAGYIMNILNEWVPKDTSTRITIECYGNLPKYEFLDACSLLHEKNGLTNRRITLSGDITYTGTSIPERYSTYSSQDKTKNYFPDLTIHYPNVTDFTEMFANYKNINAIESQTVTLKDELGNVSYQLRYYWKDPKEDKYASELDSEEIEVGVRKRQIQFYDEDDMKLIADEIKDRMYPFSTALNLTSMFLNDSILEYIHPDTFDHMIVSDAITNSMFSGCTNLHYVELPKFYTLGTLMFNNCNKLLVYIPKEVSDISQSAFMCTSYLNGVHPVFLFEGNPDDYPLNIPYVRDARFGIARNEETGRALRSEVVDVVSCAQATLGDDSSYTERSVSCELEYFLDSNGCRVLYDVKKADYETTGLSEISIESFNCLTNADGTINTLSNSLNIGDVLYGALKNLNREVLERIAVPTYNIRNRSQQTSNALYKEEISFAKMFYDFAAPITSTEIGELGNIKYVTLLITDNSDITAYYLQSNKTVKEVLVGNALTTIENYAFADSALEVFDIENISNSNLTSIGSFAFSNTNIGVINIPDTVTEIGERAYANNNCITDLKYSNSMTYVPIGCFNQCDTKTITTETIRGFNPEKLTKIEAYAFNNAIGLLLLGHDPEQGEYNCYWQADETKSKFLDYFPNLQSIGDSAFLNISNIRTVKLNPAIKNIGAAAFIPPQSEYGQPTLLEWDFDSSIDYEGMVIGKSAFAGRQFDWNVNGYGGYNGIIEKTVFVPKSITNIAEDGFSPSSDQANTSGKSVIEFVATDALSLPSGWAETFVAGQTNTIWGYKTAYLNSSSDSLYFLLQDSTAVYMKLLKDISSLTILSTITNDDVKYTVKKIANYALCDHDTNLNILVFDYNSEIETIGTHLFDTAKVSNISTNGVTELDELQSIPKTITSIGEGTPFKDTTWFTTKALDDFVYLNDTCLGYSSNTVSLVDALKAETPKTIKSSTKVIYDNAFSNTLIETIDLPASLERIGDYAFLGCVNLTNIDFTPCEETLSYIGSGAFQGCSGLVSMHYTKALRHVGKDAVRGCTITKIIFDEGCSLDGTSVPLIANTSDTKEGLDTTLTFLKISASMGNFFALGGYGYGQFINLSNLDTLILGEYEEELLNEVPEEELTDAEKESGLTYYKLNYADYFGDSGKYISAYDGTTATYEDIILHVTDSVFYKPLQTYSSSIYIARIITNLLTQEDVIRIVMGYKPYEDGAKIPNIVAKSDFITKYSAAKLTRLFNNRVSVTKGVE